MNILPLPLKILFLFLATQQQRHESVHITEEDSKHACPHAVTESTKQVTDIVLLHKYEHTCRNIHTYVYLYITYILMHTHTGLPVPHLPLKMLQVTDIVVPKYEHTCRQTHICIFIHTHTYLYMHIQVYLYECLICR
jgi:hypothetical protein